MQKFRSANDSFGEMEEKERGKIGGALSVTPMNEIKQATGSAPLIQGSESIQFIFIHL